MGSLSRQDEYFALLHQRISELSADNVRLEGEARQWMREALEQNARADAMRAERDEARADAMAAILDRGLNGPAGRGA